MAVAKLADATEVRLGEHHSCARRTTGQVACWGRNDGGQLGGATQSDWSTRIPVKDLASAVALGLGPRQACVATTGGQAQCWGHDEAGILGGATGQVLRAPAPPLRGLDRIVEVDPTSTHACARLTDGRVACWGSNDRGQLGDGGLDHEPRPVAVTGL